MDDISPVDIAEIKRNAQIQGVALAEITLIYRGLTDEEVQIMEQMGLIATRSGDSVLARFCENGDALFAQKAVGVYSLGA